MTQPTLQQPSMFHVNPAQQMQSTEVPAQSQVQVQPLQPQFPNMHVGPKSNYWVDGVAGKDQPYTRMVMTQHWFAQSSNKATGQCMCCNMTVAELSMCSKSKVSAQYKAAKAAGQ